MERYSGSSDSNNIISHSKQSSARKNRSRSTSPVSRGNKNSSSYSKIQEDKITLYILTRDFRTSDNLTLYRAYDESVRSGTHLCVVFRFSPDQIEKEKNPFFSSYAFQFMIEALEELSKEINFTYLEPISDEEFKEFLENLPLHKIFIARDFTPFARKRFEFLSSIASTVEVDDITVFPVEEYNTYVKLAHFIDFVKRLSFPKLEIRDVKWLKDTKFLNDFSNISKFNYKFIHKAGEEPIAKYINYDQKRNPIVRPSDLKKYLDRLGEHIKGYSQKKIREQVGSPKVSYLSTFIKFGLVSIRTVHTLAKQNKSINSEDKLGFERELYFKDFYYRLAWSKPHEVFEKPNWQGKVPRFISEEDLLRFKKENGMKESISKEEFKDIEVAREIYNKWTKGETESPLINAGIKEMTQTGYMLNRLRMLTCSYLTQDHGLWWKYAEKFFACNLIDYDWTVNSMNHQNVAKVGLYPKYTQNFSIKRQESMNPSDKQKYYNKYK
jgi:deoxyribodipyrimidine photolyase